MNIKSTPKKIVLAIVLIVTIVAICCLVRKDIKDFEKAIVIRTQEHLLSIAKAEARHIEDIFNDIQSDLEILALNATVQKKIRENIRKSHEQHNEQYCPTENTFKHLHLLTGVFVNAVFKHSIRI